MSPGKVGIVGSGLVGKSWAMIFASAGYEVCLFDIESSQVEKALQEISEDLVKFESDGGLRGADKFSAEQQTKLISSTTDLTECVKDAVWIQECVPEDLPLKIKVWTGIDAAVTSPKTVLASSTSCIVPSDISEGLKARARFIVAHPVNPPYLAPMVELVPAPWTSDETRAEARQVMKDVGQVPVSLSTELPGFVLNRIQYAILRESWNLVAANVVSADDLDVVMRDGLGLRYAIMGPMETIHLNADGTQNYMDRYGSTMYRVTGQLGGLPEAYKQDTAEGREEVSALAKQMEALYPLDKLKERRERRDAYLAQIAKMKKEWTK